MAVAEPFRAPQESRMTMRGRSLTWWIGQASPSVRRLSSTSAAIRPTRNLGGATAVNGTSARSGQSE